jgi:DNA polymerase III epsilon subunit-like protein
VSTLTDAQYELFERLTARPFVVLDMEWANDAEQAEHIISVAITRVVRGKRTTEGEYYKVVKPGVPIDPLTQAKHGFTDEAVKRKPRFWRAAPDILEALRLPDAILVSHGAIDARVLGDNLRRLEDVPEAEVGFDDLPDLPLLDTTRLPRLVQHPAGAQRATVSLPDLCAAVGVTLKNHHHARDDARATADALVKLLSYAAAEGTFGSIEDLLRAADAGTARTPRGALFVRSARTAPTLSLAHRQRHAAEPLTHAGTAAERDLWLDRARECVQLRCHLLEAEAELAAPHNAGELLKPLTALLDGPLDPGQAGTLAGVLRRLLRASGAFADTDVSSPALGRARVMYWWRDVRAKLDAAPRCSTGAGQACPACWDRLGCATDVLYQAAVEEVVFADGPDTLTQDVVKNRLVGTTVGKSRVVDNWARNHPREAAYVLELVCRWAEGRGVSSTEYLTKAREHGIELHEPRLALRLLNLERPARGFDHARKLAERACAARTTDPAYGEIDAWLSLNAAAEEERRRRSLPRVIVKPRVARPQGRVPSNPYRPF